MGKRERGKGVSDRKKSGGKCDMDKIESRNTRNHSLRSRSIYGLSLIASANHFEHNRAIAQSVTRRSCAFMFFQSESCSAAVNLFSVLHLLHICFVNVLYILYVSCYIKIIVVLKPERFRVTYFAMADLAINRSCGRCTTLSVFKHSNSFFNNF